MYPEPHCSSVRTWSPTRAAGTAKWLHQLGPVRGLTYGWTVPGGYDQMSCTLVRPPDFRTDAMDPARYVEVMRGGSVVWFGHLDEPAPGPGGGTITAHGAGAVGTEWDALWATWTHQDDA